MRDATAAPAGMGKQRRQPQPDAEERSRARFIVVSWRSACLSDYVRLIRRCFRVFCAINRVPEVLTGVPQLRSSDDSRCRYVRLELELVTPSGMARHSTIVVDSATFCRGLDENATAALANTSAPLETDHPYSDFT